MNRSKRQTLLPAGALEPSVPFALVAWMGLLFASGCDVRKEEPSPEKWRLGTGQTLGEALAPKEGAAVLVLEPDDCFTCYSVLGPWLKSRARHDDMFLIFTREPGAGERRAILAAGIRADGVLEEGGPGPKDTPVELGFRHGNLVYHATRVSGSRTWLLEHLDQRSLEQVMKSAPQIAPDSSPARRDVPSEGGSSE